MKRRDFCLSTLSAAVAAGTFTNPALASIAKVTADVNAIQSNGKETILPRSIVKDFGKSMHGPLLLPGHNGYDSARRIWNGAFDKFPGLIAQCGNPSDVKRAVDFARSNNLLVAIKSGGHSMSGKSTCDGGLLIDLSKMVGVHVDPFNKTARVEPGTLLGEFDYECTSFGLATTMGTDPDTGAAGLTLGGGFGRLGRLHGLACDNLRSADVITADGRFIRASEEQNQDLLWALRGGGGNFGAVSSFEYNLHSIPETIYGGQLMYSVKHAKDVLTMFADFIQTAPDELSAALVYVVPKGGKKNSGFISIGLTYIGDIAAGEKLVAPLRHSMKPMMDRMGPKTYMDEQGRNGRLPRGQMYYMKSGFTHGITPQLIDTYTEIAEPHPKRSFTGLITMLGGQISRVGNNETAFAHRDAHSDCMIAGSWKKPEDSEENVANMRSLWKKVEPHTKGFYVNAAYDFTDQKVRGTYGANFDRLQAIKTQYDPNNMFRLNANIKPKA
ncbi:FAD-binding oxidoreductase [Oceanicoccus sagamiensis]|nr:FAD-binding oxidoreductase [Oceanicoccus sagamiensis]